MSGKPSPSPPPDAERVRVAEADSGTTRWRRWGPYLAERAWGTVREDYSAGGDAWNYFPFDHARSRVYRWNEDGLGGLCDIEQLLCFAFSFWNGVDPFLKERLFGLTNSQGNHGEDVKDYCWYLDSTPTHSWMRWRYHYPQRPFPYQQLIDENAKRGRTDPEFELLDTGVFADDAYWEITADYAKSGPEDYCIELRAKNCGSAPATLHALPTVWFRNTWDWDNGAPTPQLRMDSGSIRGDHPRIGPRFLRGDGSPTALFCDNETNRSRCFGLPRSAAFVKDGINDHVVDAAATVNPAQQGTKAALHYVLTAQPGETCTVRLHLGGQITHDPLAFTDAFTTTLQQRAAEADAFYAPLTPDDASADEAMVMRQAFAGMLWSKQFYHYDVERWLEGDPAQPPPPGERWEGRNAGWSHFHAVDVISMPDTWEYPWFAAWDLAFHCVALAHVDPAFAKRQLILLCREWYMHPNGQLPAYEWTFDDVNPPVHAWAALRVFEIDGGRDYDFLERIFHKLLINFTWWVNRKDQEGNNVFEGGFLGLDNIGPFNRSSLPPGFGHLEQSDGTAWMAMYCLNLLELALVLAHRDATYEDVATKFFEHFVYIGAAMEQQGLWNDEDGFYFDVLHLADNTYVPLRAFSMVGLIAVCAVTVFEPELAAAVPQFTRRMEWFLANKPKFSSVISHVRGEGADRCVLLSVVDPERLRRILHRVLSEQEFLSPYGLRALSRYHLDHPLTVEVGGVTARLDYEPGESQSALFGGNSNWRGPVWFPVNYLVIEALRRYQSFVGDDFKVEHPVGSGRMQTLGEVAQELSARLVALFTRDPSGRRPVFGADPTLQGNPGWRDLLTFNEYFHGDTGRGLGASHQTGWTGLVADLIASRASQTVLPTQVEMVTRDSGAPE